PGRAPGSKCGTAENGGYSPAGGRTACSGCERAPDICAWFREKLQTFSPCGLGAFLCERHAQQLQQPAALLVIARAGHHRDLQAAHLVNLVVLNLWEHQLLAQAQGVVPAAVK